MNARLENAPTFGDCLGYCEDWSAIDDALDASPDGISFDDDAIQRDSFERLQDVSSRRRFIVAPGAVVPLRFVRGGRR